MTVFADLVNRVIRRRLPGWAGTPEQFFTVVQTPSPVRWEYRWRDPVTLIRWRISDPDVIYGLETYRSLEEAMPDFVRLHLPQWDQMCAIIDADHQWCLGWGQCEQSSGWAGCEAAFRMMEQFHNPVDVAFWEADARRSTIANQADRVG